ncbi:hypothetical protein [Aliikangiella maris]|uniref:Uncharacterized protein n=2 Tax=Aliikangiella maris TaxID=3162458 RepID=A0ABV2BQ59_9GAMM
MESIVLPVKLEDSLEGLAESVGLLSQTPHSLKIQFQTKDAILGLIKSGVKVIEIPMKNVLEISIKKSIFSHKIIISVDDLNYVSQLPYTGNHEISLSVSRKNIDQAIDFVRSIRLDMSERVYNQAIKDAS